MATTSSVSASTTSTKKACKGVGCINTAPLMDDVCGKCKGKTAVPAKAEPTKPSASTASAWFKNPAAAAKPTVAAAASKQTAAEPASESVDLASSDGNKSNPWTAVGAPRTGRGGAKALKQVLKAPPALTAMQDYLRSSMLHSTEEQLAAALKRSAVAVGQGASLELAALGGLCNGVCASGAGCCVGQQRSKCCFRLHGKLLEREHFARPIDAAVFAARNSDHFPPAALFLVERIIGGGAIEWRELRQSMEKQRKAGVVVFPNVAAVRQVAAARPDLRGRDRAAGLAGEARVRAKTMPFATASRAGQNLSTSGGTGVHASSGTPRAASSQGAAPRAAVTPAASSSTGADSHSNFEHGSSPLSGTSSASNVPKSVSAAASPAASGVSSDSAAIVALAAQLQAQGAALEKMVATMDSFQRFMTSFSSRASSPAVDASCAAPPAPPPSAPSAGGGVVGGSPPLVSPDAGGGEGGAEQSHQ